ncbi:hypothetical protein PF010_g27622 [Phytophthora fragariae]|nr:hypothetical protein PF010_g27622 [Phytophthora fragariae]
MATINDMSEYERNVDLSTVNQLADCEEVNAIVIKRLEMRDRLDLVHIRLGLPTLPSAGMVADWEEVLAKEEQLIHQEYGIDHYAANSQTEMDSDVDDEQMPRRHARAATGEAANQDAFTKWCSLYRKRFKIPATKRRAQPADIRTWLIAQPMALRHLFAFLPYPEREAKDWKLEQLEA